MRRAARRDESEPAIVKAIEAVGWLWIRVSDAGLFDGFAVKAGAIVPGEIKTGSGKLTTRQEVLFAALSVAGVKVHVWRTPLEALAALGCTAVEARRGLVAAELMKRGAANVAGFSLPNVERMLSEARQRLGVGNPFHDAANAAVDARYASMVRSGVIRTHDGPAREPRELWADEARAEGAAPSVRDDVRRGPRRLVRLRVHDGAAPKRRKA